MRKNTKKKGVKLDGNIIPLRYDIKLHPDLENFTFSGEEIIHIKITKSAKEITLHSKDIDIETARLDNTFTNKIIYNANAETVTFHFKDKISPGKHKLIINSQGVLKDNMRGFYRSSYIYEGKVHNIATTQFEATDARRAFPCFDEPKHKAIFNVSLVVAKGKSGISNTNPISKTEHESGFEVIKFAPTPKMSTYLLAFIVGDFEYIEKKSKRGANVRIYTPKGKIHQADFALDFTVKVLDFYEEYFDIPYPLDTLDSIAIPDFSAGAMENWGAITYRESMLLVDPKNTSNISKQWIALVIAHELAHQWFGNLVTMEWWTHLWLNEGFASYIEYFATNKIMPELNVWQQFMTAEHGHALKLDSLHHTHPIEVEVHHPDEIGEIFDEVSYSKGASVIRMLADYLGENNFRDGLRHYLKKHSYKNTSTIHLWESFEKISKKPVRKIMHAWTSKSGYPLISISSNNTNNKLNLEQERFFQSPISKIKSKDKNIWPIPVSFGDNKINKILFDKKKITLINDAQYCKLNMGEDGFYRVKYGGDLLEKLRKPISNKELSTLDRLGIVRDLFALAESGHISISVVLEFLSAYKNEDEYIVWSEISAGISKTEQIFGNKENNQLFNELNIALFSPLFEKYGWDKNKNDNHTDILLRSLALSRLSKAGDKKLLIEVKKKFQEILNKKHIDPDIRSVIYSNIARYGGNKEFKTLIELYKKETLSQEKNRIGYALGDFKDPKILLQTCNFAISSEVRLQDAIGILNFVAMNPVGRDVWLQFITQNWETMLKRYGDGGYAIARFLKSFFYTPEQKHLLKFKKFFKNHKAPGAERAVEQVIENIESNIIWLKRDKSKVSKFLKTKNL